MSNDFSQAAKRARRSPRASVALVSVLAVVSAALVSVLTPTTAQAATPPATVPIVVSGDALAGLTLSSLGVSPPFNPDIHDYAIRCQAARNDTTLHLSAAPGGSITVDGSSGASLNVAIGLWVNQALVVTATDPDLPSGPPTEYWLRCLPHDFPELDVVDAGTASPGWYFTGNIVPASNGAPSDYYAMILDEHGTPVWYQQVPTGPINTRLLPGNVVAWAPSLGPGFGTNAAGAYTLFDLDTKTYSALPAPIQPTDAHELIQLPNGHRVLIATPVRSGFDLSGLGSVFDSTHSIVDCLVEEVDGSGGLVWQWRMSDHVGVDEAEVTPRILGAPRTVNGTSVADVFHCNSADIDTNGDLLVSARHLNAVFKVNRATGTIIWKVGGTASNHDNAKILTVQNDPESPFSGQHDARFRPNGNISIYDNHTNGTGPATARSTRLTSTREPRRWCGNTLRPTGFPRTRPGASDAPPTGATTSSDGGSNPATGSLRSTQRDRCSWP